MLVKRLYLGIITGILLTSALALALAYFSEPAPAEATAFTIEDIGSEIGLGTTDLKGVVINIIRWALGIMALVGVVFIIYGGIIWMTSHGNKDKIDKAKQIIISAVIGLIIVLISWAIVTFVIETVIDVITPGEECGNEGESCGWCLVCDASLNCVPDLITPECQLPANSFRIIDIETSHEAGFGNNQEVNRCSKVKPEFNHLVDNVTFDAVVADGSLKVARADDETAIVNGEWSRTDKVITFKHKDELYEEFTDYTAHIPKTLEDTGGLGLSYCTADGGCVDAVDHYEWTFTTNDKVDEIVPFVEHAYPVISTEEGYPDTDVPRDPIFSIWFNEPIDETTMADEDSHPIPAVFKIEQMDGPSPDGNVVMQVDPTTLIVSSGAGNRVDISIIGGNILEAFTWYRITLQNVEDLCGNPLQPPEIWEFETNDTVAGIAGWDPTGDLVCPDTNITVVFNTSMWNNTVEMQLDGPGGVISMFMPKPSEFPGPPYQVVTPDGIFRILDPDPDDPGRHFKVYQFDPEDDLASDSDFTVTILTDKVINQDGDFLIGGWSFATATPETCVCQPFVTTISPATGSPGECVTIHGSCFLGTNDNVAVHLDPEFDTDFTVNPPPPVSSPTLNDPQEPDYIVTTIPETFVENDNAYTRVTIDYDEESYGNQESNTNIYFRINDPDPAQGPCLFNISPNQGYRDVTEPTARGIRFQEQEAASAFTYFNNQDASILNWNHTSNPNSVKTRVPAAANTGNVYLTDKDGNESNPLPFTVLEYPPGSLFVTGPWPTCTEACPNLVLHNNFSPGSIDVDETTLIANNTVEIQRCDDETCTSFDEDVEVDNTIYYDADTDRMEFQPNGNLDQNRWYAAILVGGEGGIQGTEGQLLANTNTIYFNQPAYQWKFKIKDDPTLCQIDRVEVTPATRMLTNEGQTTTFHSAAYASPDSCDAGGQQIDGRPWDWTITPAADADFSDDLDVLDNDAVVTALQETLNPPAPDWADVRAEPIDSNGNFDTGQLTIDYLYCDETTDCTQADLCPGSTCNNEAHRCTPVITDYSPPGGDIGTWLTINGCYFGSYRRGICNGGVNDGSLCDSTYQDCPGGNCEGGSQVIYSTDKQGNWADNDICPNPNRLWGNYAIVASEVPNRLTPGDPSDDAVTGPISIVRGIDGEVESTNDPDPGELILPDFDVNGDETPGICAMVPDQGPEGMPSNVIGQHFEDAQGPNDTVTFAGILSTIGSWADALIDLFVPLNVLISPPDVDVVVHKGDIDSNAFPFTVTTSTCLACIDDANCDVGFGCSNSGCCEPWPAVVDTIPPNDDTDVCLNTLIGANFDTNMDTSTFNDANVIVTVDGGEGDSEVCGQPSDCLSGVCEAGFCVGNSVDISFTEQSASRFRASPGLLLRLTKYQVYLTGLESSLGVRMPDYPWFFTTLDSDEVCKIDRIDVDPSLWEPDTLGQTEIFTATPESDLGPIGELPGIYDWTWDWSSSNLAVATLNNILDLGTTSQATAITGLENGQSILTATASIFEDGNPAGDKSGTALINYLRCENPWTFDDALDNCDLPGEGCADYNFHIGHCRDGSNILPDYNLQVIKGKTGDVLKQFLFKENDPDEIDAIGLRIYDNTEGLSPEQWFVSQFPFETGTPSGLIVDGYQAVRSGRTVYVAATNLDEGPPGILLPHMYILSYNDEASAETLNIFQQMLGRLKVNTNRNPVEKEQITRDTKRLADLQDVSLALEGYNNLNENYPSMEAGTYLLTMSTSRWPSWQSTLGNELGKTLDVDPVNTFNLDFCPNPPYDQTTCWSEPTKTFQCRPDSYIYAYKATRHCEGGETVCISDSDCPGVACEEADAYSVYSNMEYSGVGNWLVAGVGDPCSFDAGQGDSRCDCFNYLRP